MTSSGVGPLSLAGLREMLAVAPGAGRLRPLGLREVIEGDDALDQLPDVISRLTGAKSAPDAGVVVLAADTPMLAAGGRELRSVVESALRARQPVRWVSLGADVHADETTVAAAAEAVAGAGCVVSVGSGTVTDIGKAAAPAGTPLVVVQTATSVNGYADPLSVLLRDGVKRTTKTRWPDTLLIDPAVLAGAPPDLSRAGAGDMMAMFTAPADWYLASALHTGPGAPPGADPPYHPAVTALTRPHGARLLELATDLASPQRAGGVPGPSGPTSPRGGKTAPHGHPASSPGNTAALAELARILTLSGIAMGVAGATAPASGMEHAISHLLEMSADARGEPASFHGTQVGAASVVAAATWAHVRQRIAAGALDRPARLPDPDAARDAIAGAFADIDPSGAMAAECFRDYAQKLSWITAVGRDPLAGLRRSWAEHEKVLDSLLAGPGQVAAALRSAGLPATFGELPEPVSDSRARWAVAGCALMRQRFGVADLAMLTGSWDDAAIDEVMAGAAAAGQP
ncbi:MAG TPA: iron-containing alcohol dehydrogenase [Streptosporangiaceae bacterium]|nr:iron-containing alcohol dehydrogenase [Streptosporangiaceae bacterium]